MARPNIAVSESKRAKELLDLTLAEESAEYEAENQISVEEARQQRPIVSYDTGRDKTRVLFVTNDISFLNPADDSLERFYALEPYFDEMHVMVLRSGVIPTKPVLRVRPKIWVYIASAKHWWYTPFVAHKEITPEQLVFADGFRPDLVVALEPFEAALAAQMIGKTYNRPVQIHVRRNFLTKGFRRASSRNSWRILLARYILKRATSVRVQTSQIRNRLSSWLPTTARVEVLPRFNNFSNIVTQKPAFNLHEKYPMYERILLYIGALDYNSTLFAALDKLKYVLANPRVGLVIIGDGPIRKDCERKIKKLHLETQTVFATKITETVTYLKTADVLVVTDQTALADEVSLQGAVTTLPSVMTSTEVREEFFENDVNAFIMPPDAPDDFWRSRLNAVVHDTETRERFKQSIRNQVRPRISSEAEVYQSEYRNSIERVFLDDSPAEDVADEEGGESQDNQ